MAAHERGKLPRVLNYNQAHYFHIVASEGSISRAAEKLGVSPANVSEQVRIFERSVGKQLFQRTPTGVRLTDAGRSAFAETTVMFQAADRLEQDLALDRTTTRGLDVGISASASRSIAAEFLTPLLALDDVIPSVRSGHSNDLLLELRERRLDLVLCEDAVPNELLDAVEVHRPKLVVVAPPDGDVAKLPLVTYLPGSPLRTAVEAYARDVSPELRIAAETDDAFFAIEVAARGLGFAVVPRSVARDALRRGRVRRVAELPTTTIALSAVFRREHVEATVRRAVELLVSFANEKLDPEP